MVFGERPGGGGGGDGGNIQLDIRGILATLVVGILAPGAALSDLYKKIMVFTTHL